jgi:hypothetical protein
MAFNGSGTFNRIYNWTTDAGNGIDIEPSRMDGEDNGFATGLSNCITKDGQTTITANIPFNSKKITGLANGSARTDSIALGQVQDNTFGTLGTLGGSANTYTASPSPAITSYATGSEFNLKVNADNTGASTLNISAVGAKNIKKYDGAGSKVDIEAGDLQQDQYYKVIYDGTDFILNNPEIIDSLKANNLTINTAIVATGAIKDEDDMSSDSATALATQQSIKAYVDNIPMFKANIGSAQTIAHNTITKLQFDTKSFDTNSWYDNSTSYRYTPQKAGKYLVIAKVLYNNSNNGERLIFIYKNGSSVSQDNVYQSGTPKEAISITSIVEMNGSSDYIEIFSKQVTGGNANTYSGSDLTEFSAIYIGS